MPAILAPAIFSHPGRIAQGRVEDAMVSAYDFMPTLLDYQGLPTPDDRNLPGRSFVPALLGEPFEGRQEVAVYDEYGPMRMVRTAEWKYPHELYDLAQDPAERSNLAAESGQSRRIGKMKAMMDEWFDKFVDPRRDGLSPPKYRLECRRRGT